MVHLLIFGLGYAGARIAARLRPAGWRIDATGGEGNINFDAAEDALAAATHVVSTVPPEDDADPVLARYGQALSGKWLGYLSSTGVYGDCGGAWVDESAPLRGRRVTRIAADRAWLALGAHVFRLPGIYGPGRSELDRLRADVARRVDCPGQMFSRIHVDDVATGVIAGFGGPPGAYNLADDHPAGRNRVIEAAARLVGIAPPPLIALDALDPQSRAFYNERRRVSNGKAKRVLGWRPAYPDFLSGLLALGEANGPATVGSTAPGLEGQRPPM